MDGGKYFNRVQTGSFQHRSMTAALRVQYGPGWTTTILHQIGIHSQLQDTLRGGSGNMTLTVLEKFI